MQSFLTFRFFSLCLIKVKLLNTLFVLLLLKVSTLFPPLLFLLLLYLLNILPFTLRMSFFLRSMKWQQLAYTSTQAARTPHSGSGSLYLRFFPSFIFILNSKSSSSTSSFFTSSGLLCTERETIFSGAGAASLFSPLEESDLLVHCLFL